MFKKDQKVKVTQGGVAMRGTVSVVDTFQGTPYVGIDFVGEGYDQFYQKNGRWFAPDGDLTLFGAPVEIEVVPPPSPWTVTAEGGVLTIAAKGEEHASDLLSALEEAIEEQRMPAQARAHLTALRDALNEVLT